MTNEFFLMAIGALLLQCAILYLIIASATKAEKRTRYDWAQTQFLAYIAKVNEMSEDEIKNIMSQL